MLNKPLVGILMGSDSDLEIMREASDILKQFGIEHEMKVLSAHMGHENLLQSTLNSHILKESKL